MKKQDKAPVNGWLVAMVVLSLPVGGLSDLVVKTSKGQISGNKLISRGGREYYSFSRIPFAEPPLGKLRFMDPVPPKPWSGVLNGTGALPICLQISPYEIGNEDCLYLSVNTPTVKPKKPLPVIIFIHFGAFVKGFVGPEDVGRYFMDEDVIVVFVLYRLGLLGFLSLETKELPGNQGLKDQAMAVEWTVAEISNFGGDPSRITTMGSSAGGSSAMFLNYSPRTRNLITGCISMSGTAGATWALSKKGEGRLVALQLGKELGCPEEKTMVSCLQAKPIKEIIMTSIKAMSVGLMPIVEVENEGAIITEWPPKNPGKFPLLVGHTANEGILQAGYLEYYKGEKSLKNYTEDWKVYLPDQLGLENPDDAVKIHERFFKGQHPYKSIEQLHSEAYMVYPALKDAKNHAGPVYLYTFNYTGGPTLYEMRLGKKLDGIEKGACHADDIYYYLQFYGFYIPEGWPSPKDVEFSKKIVKFMASFAAHQDPTPGGSDIKWPQFTERKHLDLNNNGIVVKEYTEADEITNFWDKIPYHATFKYHDF